MLRKKMGEPCFHGVHIWVAGCWLGKVRARHQTKYGICEREVVPVISARKEFDGDVREYSDLRVKRVFWVKVMFEFSSSSTRKTLMGRALWE